MALAFRPHTWIVYPPSVAIQAGKSLSPSYPEGTMVMGQFSGISAEAALGAYNVEVERGYELLMNVPDAVHHVVGAKVVKDGQAYIVAAPALVQSHGLPADNARVLLKEIRTDAR